MHYISFKQRIRNKIDCLLRTDRRTEYGYMAKDAYLAPDVIVFNKKNLFLYENTSVPEGGGNIESSQQVYHEKRIVLKL